jgi:hypothetical protein
LPIFQFFNFSIFQFFKFSFFFWQAERISQEFLNQYQNEMKYKLNPTAMWSTLNDNFKLGMYDSQVKFITFIVQPMWTVIADIFPEFTTNEDGDLMGALKINKNKWSKMLEEEKLKVAKEEETKETKETEETKEI